MSQCALLLLVLLHFVSFHRFAEVIHWLDWATYLQHYVTDIKTVNCNNPRNYCHKLSAKMTSIHHFKKTNNFKTGFCHLVCWKKGQFKIGLLSCSNSRIRTGLFNECNKIFHQDSILVSTLTTKTRRVRVWSGPVGGWASWCRRHSQGR